MTNRQKRESAILRNEKKIKALSALGDKFSKENMEKHQNAAVKKVIRQLDELGAMYSCERKVVIKHSNFYNGPKLYLLDFHLPSPINLIIEVDGGYHSTPYQSAYDRKRDSLLCRRGDGRTIRITNEQVLSDGFSIANCIPRKLVDKIKKLSRAKSSIPCKEHLDMLNDQPKGRKSRKEYFLSKWLPLFIECHGDEFIKLNPKKLSWDFYLHSKPKLNKILEFYPSADKVKLLIGYEKGVYIENGLNYLVSNFFKRQ